MSDTTIHLLMMFSTAMLSIAILLHHCINKIQFKINTMMLNKLHELQERIEVLENKQMGDK